MHKQKITDFTWLLKKVWCISDEDYQERIWVRCEDPNIVDDYEDTTMYFTEDSYAILKAADAGRVELTEKQYQLLKQLYDMVEDFRYDPETSYFSEDVVKDPKWHKICDFAKIVYKELTQ